MKNQADRLNNIFDECLDRVLKGEGIEVCLKDYPEFASELEPLLKTSLAVKQASSVKPREEFRARARYEFREVVAEKAQRKTRPAFGFLPRWATVVAVVLAVVLAGSGTVYAASGSMPDSPLYPVKLASEQARMMLPGSNEKKAEAYADYMDRRISEIVYLAGKGDQKRMAIMVKRLDRRLITLAAMTQAVNVSKADEAAKQRAPSMRNAPQTASPAPAPEVKAFRATSEAGGTPGMLRTKIARYAASHPAKLKAALSKAPEPMRADIARAISIATSGYERALRTLD